MRMMPTIFGAVTGKHGVGIEKVNSMCVPFSPQENAHMFGIKRAVDPLSLLNPGKVIPTLNRCAEYGKMLFRACVLQHPELERFEALFLDLGRAGRQTLGWRAT
jgi:glycolate oxidase